MQGCIDWTSDLTFRRDHKLEVEEFDVGLTFRGTGTWRLDGRDYIVLDYQLRAVDATILEPHYYHRSYHIGQLNTDELIVDDMLYQAVYKRVQ
ncbi:MAG: hypothetical protein ABR611_06865 [Chthoniobacterales bacterium]